MNRDYDLKRLKIIREFNEIEKKSIKSIGSRQKKLARN
jgi:hypothetical protein